MRQQFTWNRNTSITRLCYFSSLDTPDALTLVAMKDVLPGIEVGQYYHGTSKLLHIMTSYYLWTRYLLQMMDGMKARDHFEEVKVFFALL